MSSVINIRQTIDEYVSGTGKDTLMLAHNPLAIREVSVNGVMLEETDYSFEGNLIKFTNNVPEIGENNVRVKYVYYNELPMLRGKEGKSAYQVAKENGYSRTELEFNTTLGNIVNIITKMDAVITKDDVLIFIDAPTVDTVGYVGQKCVVNKENLYICLGNDDNGYIWKQLA